VEKKRLLGNPGKRALPGDDVLMLEGGRVDPPEDLGPAGLELWSRVFDEGEIWISPRLDFTLLERVCRALDRAVLLEREFGEDPTNRQIVMSINETDKLIYSGLGLLGFTPSDRAKLGLAEVKAKSKWQEFLERTGEG